MYTCVHQKQKTCFSDGECDDGNACTSDGCKETKCVHEHSDDPYCCMHDTECDDGNPCTEGKCVGNVCKYQILSDEGCCKTNMECDDGIGCTMDECADWTCKHTPVGAKCCTPETETIVCDDGNPCTIDQCINGLCQWQMVTTGCCEKDDDCMDCVDTVTGASCAVDHTVTPPQCKGESCLDNICTMHSCANKLCYYAPVSNCCLTDQDCKDEKECTLDSCGADHKCKHEFQESCCSNNGMCNDGNICTIDLCDIPAGSLVGTCKYQKKVPCCTSEVDCAPKTCKKTVCQNGNCIYLPLEDCCIHDEDCNDDDVCTIDKCLNNVCEHIPSGICG
jgi:hypothetical protein